MNIEIEYYNRYLPNAEPLKHRPMEEEYTFYQAVKSGNVNSVLSQLQNGHFANPDGTQPKGMGTLSHSPLTNIKYHFVVATALITRHCVEGGMELELSYQLSDFYIQRCDRCNAIEQVISLHKKMVLDFTNRMLNLQKAPIHSKPVIQCIDYIYEHIQERVTVAELSAFTNLSPNYLSKIFKKECGIMISEYIQQKKMELAQNLLKYSNYSIIEIANYLSFSSQSHFIQTFKKYSNCTPKKFRDSFYRTL